MARPLPVNLVLAGTGAILIISGISNQTLAEVLQGNFGNLKENGTGSVADTGSGGGSESEIESSPSASTLAPSPDTFHRHVTKKEEAEGIAGILLSEGIHNPTNAQIEAARALYNRK